MVGNNETGGHLPFGQRPPGPVVNGGHPLARGMVFCVDYYEALGPGHRDLVGGVPGTFTGTSMNKGPWGQECTFLSNTDVDTYATPGPVNSLSTLTVEFMGKFNVDTFMTIFGKGSNVSAGDGQIFFCINWDDISHSLSVGAGYATTSAAWHDTGANFPPNAFTHCVVTADFSNPASPIVSIYKNGAAQAITTDHAPAGARVADSSTTLIGNFFGQAFGAQMDLCYLRIWNRVLLPQECRSLSVNPWQPYRQFYQLGPALLSSSTVFTQAALASNAAVAQFSRIPNKSGLASNAAVALIQKQLSRSVTASNAAVALLTKKLSRTLLASNAAVALFSKLRLVSLTCSNAAQALLARLGGKTFTVNNAAVALIQKQIARKITVSNAAVALLATLKARLVSITVNNAAVARFSTLRAATLLASNAAQALLAKSVAHKITVSNSAVALLAKAKGKTILVSNSAVALFSRLPNKSLLASNSAVASLIFRAVAFLRGNRSSVTLTGDSGQDRTTLGGGKNRTDLDGNTM